MNLTPDNISMIVDKLYRFMADDLSGCERQWSVNPNEFLPANVCCDHAGMQSFKKALYDIIDKSQKQITAEKGQ